MEEYLKLCKISLSIDEDDIFYDSILNLYIEMTIENLKDLTESVDITYLENNYGKSRIATMIIANVTYLFNNRESYVDGKTNNKIIKTLLNSIIYRGI